MKTLLAISVGIILAFIGLFGLVWPLDFLGLGGRFLTPHAVYATALSRLVAAAILLAAAGESRFPKTIGVFGVIALVNGIVTLWVGLAGNHSLASSWLHQSMAQVRFDACVALALGGAILGAVTRMPRIGDHSIDG